MIAEPLHLSAQQEQVLQLLGHVHWWVLFVVLSPAHYYPLPFAPFALGTLGAQEALV